MSYHSLVGLRPGHDGHGADAFFELPVSHRSLEDK